MNTWLALAIMILTVYLIRLLPLLFLRKELKSRWLRSFLHYVPYVTLAVMTFPAIIEAGETPLAGVLALAAGLVTAWISGDLFIVAISCCVVMFVAGLF
ncbi:MAG: AzlD domain-containing protein [Lachnospiraceae bacterium]|nr:AzlD domain-containing protein [Lachnospiraceae bacterium]